MKTKLYIIILFLTILAGKTFGQCISTNNYYLADFNLNAVDNGKVISLRKGDWCNYNSITIHGTRRDLIKFVSKLKRNNYKIISFDGYNWNVKGLIEYGFYSNLIIVTPYQGCYGTQKGFFESLEFKK